MARADAREQNAWEPGLRATLEIHNPSGMPRIERRLIEGPYNVTGISETPSRQTVFTCRPAAAAEEQACAEKIISTSRSEPTGGRSTRTTSRR